MKQTAVQWLFEQYFGVKWDYMPNKRPTIFEEAKEMEKEQIKDAYESGVWDVGCRNADSKKYYNETYGDK
jgi:hypothetical protein